MKFFSFLIMTSIFLMATAKASVVERDLKVVYQSVKNLNELTEDFLKYGPVLDKLERQGRIHHQEAFKIKKAWQRIFDMRVVLNTLYQTYEGFNFKNRALSQVDARLIQYSSLLHLVNSGARLSRFLWKRDKGHKLLNEAHPSYPLGTLISFENEIFSIYNKLPKSKPLQTFFPVIEGAKVEELGRMTKSLGSNTSIAPKLRRMNRAALWIFKKTSRPFVSNPIRQLTIWKRFQVFQWKNLFSEVVKKVSTWLGDTKVKRQDDRYYNGKTLIDLDKALEFEKGLESGDIMISRTNWYLSNAFLPGFWPHSFLYVGGLKKLAALGSDKEVDQYYQRECAKRSIQCVGLLGYLEKSPKTRNAYKDYLRKTKLGHSKVLIEATSDGVHFSSVRHTFLNDFLGAMRPKVSKLSKALAIEEAFSFFGAPYDFDFDFDTHDSFVCSELVAKSYMPYQNKRGVTFDYDRKAGNYVESYVNRYALPVVGLLRKMVDENVNYHRNSELEFVGFLKGVPSLERSVISTEKEFYDSLEWPKWSFMQ